MSVTRAFTEREAVEFRGKLGKEFNAKYGLIFDIGIETGLRISDIVNLKAKDIIDSKQNEREKYEFWITEQKTQKPRLVEISKYLWASLRGWSCFSNGFLFESVVDEKKHISRIQVYRVFGKVADAIGYKGIGTHSLRKTYAVRYFHETGDLIGLQALLNHSYPSTTLSYILTPELVKKLQGKV